MKSIDKMSQAELAAYVNEHLRNSELYVVLSGGAAVGIYSDGEYVSGDIDFVNAGFANWKTIEKSMGNLGFFSKGRHFEHPKSDHIVEFPPGPLQFGDGSVKNISELVFDTGRLQIISPTDCIKDRLAHFYHWGDRQCLKQALLVASKHSVNLRELQEWSKSEGKLDEFEKIKNELKKDC